MLVHSLYCVTDLIVSVSLSVMSDDCWGAEVFPASGDVPEPDPPARVQTADGGGHDGSVSHRGE